jgi:hypothetical protein
MNGFLGLLLELLLVVAAVWIVGLMKQNHDEALGQFPSYIRSVRVG